MSKIKSFFYFLTLFFGAFMVVYGERDDSPGAQGLGLILAIFGVVSLIRGRKKQRHSA